MLFQRCATVSQRGRAAFSGAAGALFRRASRQPAFTSGRSVLLAATAGVTALALAENTVYAEPAAADAGLNSVLGTMGVPGDASSGDAPKRKKKTGRRSKRKGKKKISSGQLPNPGKMEDAGRMAKDTCEVNTFCGARVNVSKELFPREANPKNQKKQVALTGTTWMGSPQLPEGHTNDIQIVTALGTDHVLIGSLDTGGRVMGRYVFNPAGSGLTCKGMFQIVPDNNYRALVLDADYKGQDYSVAVNWAQTQCALSYFQSLTPTFAVGIQGVSSGILTGRSMLIYCAQYKAMNASNTAGDVVTAQMQGGAVILSYARKVSQFMTVASELQYMPGQGSAVSVGCAIQRHMFQYNGSISSEGKVAATLDQSINEVMRFSLSGEIVHGGKEANFGFGLSIG